MITIGLVRFIGSISSALQVLEKYKDINVKTFLTSAVTYGTYNGGKGRPFSAKLADVYEDYLCNMLDVAVNEIL